MAVSKTQKGRIDFSAALNDALYISKNEDKIKAPGNESSVVKQVDDNMIMSTDSTKMQKSMDPVSKNDSLFLSLVKGERGTQRSVYFESDVYEYIQSITKEYGANFSNVVNLLLKEAMKIV